MPPKTFWELVVERRNAKGWSRDDLAAAAGVSKWVIRNGEQGSRPNPTRETMCQIASALGFSAEELGQAICPGLPRAA
jgi:transcriptional regulator with XRE-family HTH domain